MPEKATGPAQALYSSGIATRASNACDEARYVAKLQDRRLPPAPICEELRMAVERAATRSAVSMDALRLAVRRFTIALRDDGAAPEDILIALKSVINTLTFEVLPNPAGDWSFDDLRHMISTWSVQEFFSERQAGS